MMTVVKMNAKNAKKGNTGVIVFRKHQLKRT